MSVVTEVKGAISKTHCLRSRRGTVTDFDGASSVNIFVSGSDTIH